MHVNMQKLKEVLRETRVTMANYRRKSSPGNPWSVTVVAENSDIGFKGAMVLLGSKIMFYKKF